MTSYCGLVALLGEANAGKSTLLNALTGEKISIVSEKPHTTRHGIYGVVCRQQTQMVFIDTPGLIHKPHGALHAFMVRMTKRAWRDADVCVIVIDAARTVSATVHDMLARLHTQNRPIIVVLNKIDTVAKEKLLPLAASVQMFTPHIVMASAKQNKGVDHIFQLMQQFMPQGPWLFDAQDLTQISQRFWAAEMTREKVFQAVHHEVPYHTNVVTDEWKEDDQAVTLRQTIVVDDVRYRKWILGFQGKRIKRIGHQARLEMADHLGKNVHLFLTVQVDPRWSDHIPLG